MLERKLVDFPARVFDPERHAHDREDRADDRQLDHRRDAHQRQRDADRGEQRQNARAGEVHLLADGRNLGVERAHETYRAATTNVMPNMNMQIPPTIRAMRMFLRASRRSMGWESTAKAWRRAPSR